MKARYRKSLPEDRNSLAFAAAISLLIALAPLRQPQAQDDSDADAVLYKAADTLGMLRTSRELDRIATMMFSGDGTGIVNDQLCQMSRYRAEVRYPIPEQQHTFPTPGMRVDFTCERSDGATERQIQVVAGTLAWNEAEPGLGAAPAPDATRERLLQIWLLPQGLIKAAVAADSQTVASVDGTNPTLTFPLPAPLDDTRVTITLDPEVFLTHTMPNGVRRDFSHRITHVETTFDGRQFDVDYADYQDWNPDDYKSDVLLPGRIVQSVDGTVTLDLTLRESNTYNPYVIMPVPENIAP
ncbi:MAG: hypothetical protein ACR2QQ_03260 [Gammaproteobacteria bacterium]